MHETRQNSSATSSSRSGGAVDPARLFAAFLDSGQSEAAFTRLVKELSGLVYASALRRSGDRQLAEEATQNVFSILARKASSLRRHPSLAAWLFQTTRFEVSQLQRTERRRRRKHQALARHRSSTMLEDVDDSDWQDAIPFLDASLDQLSPRDRELVLLRFFEEKKFAEIARHTGRTEAACKMQLKRVLAKLARLLSAKGVTLTSAVIAAGLGAELAKAVPASLASSVAASAYAKSSAVSNLNLLTNALQTMGAFKLSSITAVAVLALAALPLSLQYRKLAALEAQLASSTTSQRTTWDESAFLQTQATPANPAARPLDATALLNAVHEGVAGRNLLVLLKASAALATLTDTQSEELTAAVESHPALESTRELALQLLSESRTDADPAQEIERLLAMKVDAIAYADLFAQWMKDDPKSAEAWYWDKVEAGELLGTGVSDRPDEFLRGHLMAGVARHDPRRAVDMLDRWLDAQPAYRTFYVCSVAESLAAQAQSTEAREQLRRLLELPLTTGDYIEAVITAAYHRGLSGADELTRFANAFDVRLTPEVASALASTPLEGFSFEARANWLLEHLTEDEAVRALPAFIGWSSATADRVVAWLQQQPSAAIADRGYLDLANRAGTRPQAMDLLQRIQNAEVREPSLRDFARDWLADDRDEAVRHLPRTWIQYTESP